MKKFLADIMKYVKILLIVLIVVSIVSVIISNAYEFKISDVFYYAALLSFIIAFLPVLGSIKGSTDSHYIRSVTASSGSVYDDAKETARRRNGSFVSMIFMTILGIMLMIICHVLAKAGL